MDSCGDPAFTTLAGFVVGGILGWAIVGLPDPGPAHVRFAVVWSRD